MNFSFVSLFSAVLFVGFLVQAQTLNVPGSRKGKLISEAVAQVADEVITSRGILISYAIDQALAQKKAPPKDRSVWLLTVNSEAFQKHITQVLLESVVQLEAQNFSVGEITAKDIQASSQHLNEMVKGWSSWAELQVSASEAEKMISRKLRAKNFLKFKVETSGVQIPDEEARLFYNKNKAKFGNLPFADFKESIREVLAEEQMQEKLKDWFEILKRKYKVKFLGSLT